MFLVFSVAAFVSFFIFPEGAAATLFSSVLFVLVFLIIEKFFEPKSAEFLKKVFLAAVLLRIVLAIAIYVMGWEDIFGPDAQTFDLAGQRLVGYWTGELTIDSYGVEKASSLIQPGWGMNYLVGIVYFMSGPNPLAIQFLSCTLGAATVPCVYYCANKIFYNLRVAKYAALAVAFFPAMILWSSQMLKDGLIVFFLALTMACVIRLHKKLDSLSVVILMFSLFSLFSLRFYIFYMAAAAVVGSFIIGAGKTSESIGKRLAILLLLGVAVGYSGVGGGNSSETLETYASLERLQQYREWQVKSANSGFAEDIDTTTVEGTATLLPIGIVFILFAPFPWQMTNFRQLMTGPEMLVWWFSIPFLIKGIWYTIKNRLRESIAILTFSAMLTTAYALFQGNIGTAYRQRTQIQVFLFIFVAVGYALYKERKENSMNTMRRNRAKSFKPGN
jgi:4-amino-4-deoxy-L-arabinose transferase-like glycosyltransferase